MREAKQKFECLVGVKVDAQTYEFLVSTAEAEQRTVSAVARKLLQDAAAAHLKECDAPVPAST